VDKLVDYYEQKKRIDLYYEIAQDNIDLNAFKEDFDIEGPLLTPKKLVEEEKPTSTESERKKRKRKRQRKPSLLIGGEPADQYKYTFAQCCNPVFGDDIFAFLSKNSGVKIHRSSCPNATHLMASYGYRILKAEWVSNNNSSFVANLLITGVDDGIGIIERLSNRISSMLGLNIRSLNIEGDQGYFEGKLSLIVDNKDQLEKAMQSLKNLDMVSNVSRIDQ
jgi:GTP pyrophosphokinase